MSQRNAIILCCAVAALLAMGLVMLASTSVWIEEGARYALLKKQALWTGVGVIIAAFLAMSDYRLLRRYVYLIYGAAIVLLVLCYVPGIGYAVNGESRWILIPGVGQFQPSEAAKVALIVGMAAWYAHYQSETRKLIKGYAIPGVILALPIALIFFEKDMGTAAGLGAAGILVMYIAGTRLRYLLPSVGAAATAMYFIVRGNENRWNRIMAFSDLEEHKLGFGLQQWRALLAFGNGGADGLGLGNGAEKHGYMPFAHTDFIFPMIGEEMGLYFTLGVVCCFVMISVYGIAIAVQAPDVFGRLVALGLTCSIVIPAMVNIGVTTAVLPNTGLPLPFVSYGGSNLVLTLAAIGILVSIHRRSKHMEATELPLLEGKQVEIRI